MLRCGRIEEREIPYFLLTRIAGLLLGAAVGVEGWLGFVDRHTRMAVTAVTPSQRGRSRGNRRGSVVDIMG